MNVLTLLISLIICLVLEGFFSGSEMALVNTDKYKLAIAAHGRSKLALFALHLIKHPASFFSTTLLGTNLCTVAGSVIVTLFIIDRFGTVYAPFAVLYWPFALIFGEIVPKSVYQHYADKLALIVAPILFGFFVIFYPAVFLLSKLTDLLLGGVKQQSSKGTKLSREELELILEVGGTDTSDVKPAERTLISRIFDLAEKRVREIMTPLVDVIAVSVKASRNEIFETFEKQGFSRVTVYDGRVYNVVGILDRLDFLFSDEKASIKDLLKPVYYVPEEMPLDELLVGMKRKGEPVAVAVDEYGAATGMVTVEDLLEEIVGEIRDEHDESPTLYQRLGWHRYLVSGRMETGHANDRLGLNIPAGNYKTVAGFIINKLEKIPKAGETLTVGDYKYTVKRSTERTVLEVEIQKEIHT